MDIITFLGKFSLFIIRGKIKIHYILILFMYFYIKYPYLLMIFFFILHLYVICLYIYMLHLRGRKLFFLSHFRNLVKTIKSLDIHIKKNKHEYYYN